MSAHYCVDCGLLNLLVGCLEATKDNEKTRDVLLICSGKGSQNTQLLADATVSALTISCHNSEQHFLNKAIAT